MRQRRYGRASQGINDLMHEYGESSEEDDGHYSSGEDAENPPVGNEIGFQEMSLEERHDYENPIEAFHKAGRANSSMMQTADCSNSSETVSQKSSSTLCSQTKLAIETPNAQVVASDSNSAKIDIRQTIIQGSFLPVTVMALAGAFPVNDYIIDESQGAKLVHYLGTFGKVKALKTFMTRFKIDLSATDRFGQTIVHYAARRGELAMLKYLREVGPSQGVSLEMQNSYGLTPIVYAMMNNKTYTFIYLYFKLGCQLSDERASWTATQMVKQQTSNTEILNLLFHDERLGECVAETVLKASVEYANPDALKAVLRHLLQGTNRLNREQLQDLLAETQDKLIQEILKKYLAKIVCQTEGAAKALLTANKCCDQQSIKQALKATAPVVGFSLTLLLHLSLMAQVLALSLTQNQDVGFFQQIFYQTLQEETILVAMLGSFALLMTCLAWSLLLKPGVHPKLSLHSEGSIVQQICHEIDSPQLDELTQMNELCLVCLTEKFMHLEHCKRCNKCVRHFHLHSRFYNRCFGDANIRPYILFHFLSLLQCVLYLCLIGRNYWTETASEFLIGKLMLTHQMMPARVLFLFVTLQVYTWYILDKCLLSFSALGLGMTINEYQNVSSYAYLFETVAVKKSFDDRVLKNGHKKVACLRFLINPCAFFCACRRKPLRQQRSKASYLLLRERSNTSSDEQQQQQQNQSQLVRVGSASSATSALNPSGAVSGQQSDIELRQL